MILNNVKEPDQQSSADAYSIKVLLVDDRPENLISLESLLRKKDDIVEYLFAHSGEEALRIALEHELALILLDVQMPIMNGYEVARFLRNSSRTREIPIIFVTAIDQNASHMVEGFEVGAVDFLFKPLHPLITKAKVSAFIGFYQQKKELLKANKLAVKLNQELEDRVQARTEELTRINRDLDNFIYTASHDLKAPISNLEGLFKLYNKAIGEDAPQAERISQIQEMIFESIGRFKTTLKDLTEVAKIHNEEVTDAALLDFEDVLAEVSSDIKEAIEEADARVVSDFSEVSSLVYSRKNLRSILYNLVSNGIKYRDETRIPLIEITTRQQNEYVVLQVKDNGLGIRKEDQQKVFGMFKRLHTHVEGTGIGMAIVKRIIDNSGGRIEVESELGVGSTFKVYFKLARTPQVH